MSTSAYIPPGKRAGGNSKGETQGSFSSPLDKAGDQLRAVGFERSGGGNCFFPAEGHPHVHIGLGVAKPFMAYSEGEQHNGGRGIQMYSDQRLKDYQFCIQKMKSKYPDKKVEEVINQAAVILNAYCRK